MFDKNFLIKELNLHKIISDNSIDVLSKTVYELNKSIIDKTKSEETIFVLTVVRDYIQEYINKKIIKYITL